MIANPGSILDKRRWLVGISVVAVAAMVLSAACQAPPADTGEEVSSADTTEDVSFPVSRLEAEPADTTEDPPDGEVPVNDVVFAIAALTNEFAADPVVLLKINGVLASGLVELGGLDSPSDEEFRQHLSNTFQTMHEMARGGGLGCDEGVPCPPWGCPQGYICIDGICCPLEPVMSQAQLSEALLEAEVPVNDVMFAVAALMKEEAGDPVLLLRLNATLLGRFVELGGLKAPSDEEVRRQLSNAFVTMYLERGGGPVGGCDEGVPCPPWGCPQGYICIDGICCPLNPFIQ